jgi:hypothetical protein
MKYDIKQFIAVRQKLVQEKAQLQERLDEINSALGEGADGSSSNAASSPAPTARSARNSSSGKRTMSPEAKERIAAAQRARWAKQKNQTSTAQVAGPATNGRAKKKKTMSPEAREKIAAAQRARWARAKGK